MSRTRVAMLALAAGALAGAGCGGATKSSSRTSPAALAESSSRPGPLTRAELIAEGNVICRRVNAKRKAVTLRSQQDYQRLVPPLAAYELAAVADMRKLTPPGSMAQGWKRIVAGAQTLAEATAKIAKYARAKNFLSMPAARSASHMAVKATLQMTTTAGREGFTDCAHI